MANQRRKKEAKNWLKQRMLQPRDRIFSEMQSYKSVTNCGLSFCPLWNNKPLLFSHNTSMLKTLQEPFSRMSVSFPETVLDTLSIRICHHPSHDGWYSWKESGGKEATGIFFPPAGTGVTRTNRLFADIVAFNCCSNVRLPEILSALHFPFCSSNFFQ